METSAKSRETTGAASAGIERRRVVIEGVRPEIDCGRFPAKCEVGDEVVVEADVFADGQDVVATRLLWRAEGERGWRALPMQPLGNDRWRGRFPVERLGRHLFTIIGWVDAFESWRRDLGARVAAGQDVHVDLLIGAALIEDAARRAAGADQRALTRDAGALRAGTPPEERARHALDDRLAARIARYPDLRAATRYGRELAAVAEPVQARFSAWYEMFPRSASPEPGRHATLRDVEARLEYVAALGFDVLYLPPIHPIGTTRRKGPNNVAEVMPADPGSPWAIGSAEGGHMSIHPALGTLEDFRRLVGRARDIGIEVALDIAFQASPDHPYVRAHPEWFRTRPDGSIQYAENPPKKYEDIVPFDFDGADWRALWSELERIILFWIEQGVRAFRVDNPHTKPFAFWDWLIARIRAAHPDVILLSEAFTRPRLMYRLAKAGFSQSYTYFAWRHGKAEIEHYLTELTRTEVADYFRPNFWPNTPDILTDFLQTGGRPAFMARLVLAATLAASYGIYGPPFELLEHQPREPGSEEYLDSEKYQIRSWDLNAPRSLREVIARVNTIRRENAALQFNRTLRFHQIDSEHLLAYSKHWPAFAQPARSATPGAEAAPASRANLMLMIVNLDPRNTHAGWIDFPLADFGIDADRPFDVHDLLSDIRYTWHGSWNFVELNPRVAPAHVFRVTQSA